MVETDDPGAAGGRNARRACPVCHEDLEPVTASGIPLDTCRPHGVWLDVGEFETLLQRARGEALEKRSRAYRRALHQGRCEGERGLPATRPPVFRKREPRPTEPPRIDTAVLLDPAGSYPCPVCGRTMQAEPLRGSCDEHGAWLVRGVLAELIADGRHEVLAGIRRSVARARRRGQDETRDQRGQRYWWQT